MSGYYYYYFVTRHTLNNQKAKGLTTSQKERGGRSFPLQMGEEGGDGKRSGNATREDSCRGLIRHMIGAEVYTSINFFCFPKRSSG